MVKKFLLSAAVIGALATSAMGYDFNEVSDMNGTANQIVYRGHIKAIGFDQNQTSDGLIFPAYFVGNGWQSTIRVINTSSNPVVAKVVLYDGKDSHEVKDFNLYLSGNDEWVGTIKVDSDGVAKIISTDSSVPAGNGTSTSMASADDPMSAPITSNMGYIEVIEMADVNLTASQDVKSAGLEHDHADLRAAYRKFAYKIRAKDINNALTDSDIIFKNGVIQNQVATYPLVDINSSDNNATITVNGQSVKYVFMAPQGSLTGDIRITNTTSGSEKDMDMMAYKVNYSGANTVGQAALVYIEGEKANLADVYLDKGVADYSPNGLQTAITNISNKKYYITYGDAAPGNMDAILTDPFKRLYVQAELDKGDGNLDGQIDTNATMQNAGAKYYTDAKVGNEKNTIASYGSTSLVAQIFDENENVMRDTQFSPQTTPTIKLDYEVEDTGLNVNDPTNLAYYIKEANDAGYNAGYIILTNANSNNDIPGIMTQMLATGVNGRVITNWVVPQGLGN